MDSAIDSPFAGEIKFNNNYTSRSPKVVDIIGFLRQISIFSNLNNAILYQISNLGTAKLYRKDAEIVSENEMAGDLYLVVKGKLKVFTSNESRKKVILAVLNECDFFGEMSILNDTLCSATVTAMKESVLFVIPRNKFLELLKNHFEITFVLMKVLSHRIRIADMKIKSLSLNNAERKIAAVILELAGKYGYVEGNNIKIEKLPLQHDLANMAGTSRETVSRTLHDFIKKGFIELNGSLLTILNFMIFRESFE